MTEILIAIGGVIALVLGIVVKGASDQRKGAKAKENELRLKDHENADSVRRRAKSVRVSDDDIAYRD